MNLSGKLYTEHGFTLIEILISLAISSIVITGIYNTYSSQQESYILQERVVTMHQNLRAALDIMTREIRMAGYDPQESGLYQIVSADEDGFSFDSDLLDDGGAPGGGENFFYELYDSNGDGNDNTLRRTPGGSAVVQDIEALSFAYAYDSDDNGALEVDGGNIRWVTDSDGDGLWDRLDTNNDGLIDVNDTPGGTAMGETMQLDTIRCVRIWLLARIENPDRAFSNTSTYVVGSKHIAVNDNTRRKLMVQTIKLRNLGL
ncbi:MAG: PilW family protein [Desulfobacterium sp.]|nr:PilW family protein [Desulfobacterium sp.]